MIKYLTVVIVSYDPVVNLNEPCTHRSVTLELTPEQQKDLELKQHEQYSIVFVEPYREK